MINLLKDIDAKTVLSDIERKCPRKPVNIFALWLPTRFLTLPLCSTQMALLTTTEKLGRYEILSELGQGAMGIVYKAIDPLIDRIVAIKTITYDRSRDDFADFEERFYREAKSAGRLNHPNIVTIYDVGKSENTAYIAMEFLEGQLLKDILDVHTAMPIDRIADIAAQIAEGLAYAHKNGIVHRDIKPANIMLVQGDRAKITDFGIARMSACSETLAGTVMGSPRYMAPEQVVGKAVDGRSDLFSLGVVLYEMLTGESPFDADNINTTMYRIVNEVPIPPKTLNPRLPEAFDYIVAKALAKHPDERYQTARELVRDLQNYQDLSISESAVAALSYPITLERKVNPRSSNPGAQTIIRAPAESGKTGQKTLTGDLKATRTQIIPPPVPGFYARNQKTLVATSLVLLLGLSFSLMRDNPAPPPKIAPPQQIAAVAPAPARTITPPEKLTLAEDALRNSPLPEAVLPSETIPLDAVNADTPPLTAQEPQISKRKKPVASSAGPSAKGVAVIKFAVTPWGDVYVDGKKMGASPPLKELRVPVGEHTIEIRNLYFPPYSETMHLKANSTKKLKHIFK